MRFLLQLGVLLLLPCSGEIVDRIVAVAGGQAIKQSDVTQDLRMTAFLNGKPVVTGSVASKEAIDRLIDQAIIRDEIAAGMYEVEDPAQAQTMLKQLQAAHGGADSLRAKLQSYGLSEDALRKYLDWQAKVLRFVELRFGTATADSPANEQFFAWLDQMRRTGRVEVREDRVP